MQRQETTEYKKIELPSYMMDFLKSQNGLLRNNRSRTYSVTELIRCKRNTFFKKSRYPQETLLKQDISDLWSPIRGNLLHKMTDSFSWSELEGTKEVFLEDGRLFTICGRLDMYDEKSKTVIDLKTVNDVNHLLDEGLLPFDEHVKQIQAYYTIFGKYIPIEHLHLVYADMTHMETFEITPRDTSKWLELRVNTLQNHIDSENVPDGEVSSKCKFCKYQTACFKIPGGIQGNPESEFRRN